MDYDDEAEELDEVEERPTAGGRRRAEGVRIIGAEEAARALKEGQAAGRRPDDAPRFGDVPKRPAGPRPAQRFPLPDTVDPSDVRRPPVAGPTDLPHWTEPPSGEVPRIFDPDPDGAEEDLDAWAGFSGRGPRWRSQDSDWSDADFDDVSVLADDDLRVGALDDRRSEESDLYSFDEPEPPVVEERPAAVTTSIRTRQASPPATPPEPGGGGGGRDLRSAVGLGVALAGVALLLFQAGPGPALVLVTVVVTMAAAEAYDVLRRAGYRPATLFGLIAIVALMVATYKEGEIAIPLVMFVATIFTFLWYLFGVVRARPTVNVAVTLFVFLWIGLLGSYAALLLALPRREGIAFLLAAIIATASYDIGGLFFGSQMGSRPLAPDISPNKTVEGLVGGMMAAVFVTVVLVGVLPGIHPWSAGKALTLGLVVAVVAPLGDLCESMVKRDLGIKDMSGLLPGHGGVLDRFDALLFVLPATYYLVKLINLA